MENCAGEEQIRIDVAVVRGCHAAQMADRQHVLDQAAEVGVVHMLGRGRGAIQTRERLVIQKRVQQGAQVWIRHSGDDTAQLGEHLQWVTLGHGEVVGKIDVGIENPGHLVDGELRPVLEDLQQPFDLDEIVAIKRLDHLGDVIPHLGVHVAGPVAEQQRKIRIA